MDIKDGNPSEASAGDKSCGPEARGRGESVVSAALNFFSSVRLAVFIIAALALICAAGTLVPQAKGAHFYRHAYGAAAEFILLLALDDVYHSFVFYFAAAMLCVNIAVCSLRRLKARLAALRSETLAAGGVRDLTRLRHFRLNGGFSEERLNEVVLRLKKAGYSVSVDENVVPGSVSGFAERGRWSFAGEQLTHLSILVVIAGAMIGNIYGYKAYFRAYPGERISVPAPRYQAVRGRLERLMAGARGGGTDPHIQAAQLMKELDAMAASGEKELFGLLIKDFKTEYFEAPPAAENAGGSNASGMAVKNWNTCFSIEEGGRESFSGVVAVNSPLSYRGVNIYQSSYYRSHDVLRRVKIKAAQEAGGNSRSETLEFGSVGSEAPIFGGKFRLKLASFIYDFAVDPESREIFSAGDSPGNAAVKLLVTSADGAETNAVWLFEALPEFGEKTLGRMKYDFSLSVEAVETSEREATGLQVNYDPGAGLVWLGCFLMTFGLFVSFNSRHARMWFRFERRDGNLSAGGYINGGGRDFALEFDSIFEPAAEKEKTEENDKS